MTRTGIYRRPTRPEVYQKKLLRRVFIVADDSSTTFNQSVGGSLTMSGALTAEVVFLQALAGSMTLSGALVRQTQKALAGSMALAGTLVRQTNKSVSGALTPSGLLTKQIQTSLTGSITMSGTLDQGLLYVQAVSGILSGLAGALSSSLITPPILAAGINRIRGMYGRLFGRN